MTLTPGNFEDDLQCVLSTVSLSNHPCYEALSYTWGTDEKIHEMFHEAELVRITPNLSAAFRRLRCPHEPHALWVDAICINQDDFAERSQQVKIVGSIFEKAMQVLACLGEEVETDKEAFEMIESFDDGAGNDGFKEFVNSNVLPISATKPWPGGMNTSSFLNSEAGLAYNIGLSSLLARPWFTRSWVVQKIVLASKARVVSGTRSCSWLALLRLAFYVHDNPVPGFRSLIGPITAMSFLRSLGVKQELEQNLSTIDRGGLRTSMRRIIRRYRQADASLAKTGFPFTLPC
jgi:hypothetical protein